MVYSNNSYGQWPPVIFTSFQQILLTGLIETWYVGRQFFILRLACLTRSVMVDYLSLSCWSYGFFKNEWSEYGIWISKKQYIWLFEVRNDRSVLHQLHVVECKVSLLKRAFMYVSSLLRCLVYISRQSVLCFLITDKIYIRS